MHVSTSQTYDLLGAQRFLRVSLHILWDKSKQKAIMPETASLFQSGLKPCLRYFP